MALSGDGKIVVVAFDAGGAEILSSYVRQTGLRCTFVVDGPARAVFERKLGPITSLPLREAIAAADRVFTGTGWQSDLEFEALQCARELGKPSVAFLDHWVNYPERFERAGRRVLPDSLVVVDEHAEQIAARVFPGLPITRIPNPYLSDVIAEARELERQNAGKPRQRQALYICEPIKEHALLAYGNERHWGYTEDEAMEYVLRNLDSLGALDRVLVRPHPAERLDRYDEFVSREWPIDVVVAKSGTLIEQIVASDVVVGCNSMAMVMGLAAGKRVVCAIPPGGHACSLPHAEIEHLQRIAGRA